MKSPKTRVPKRMKARRMWANYSNDEVSLHTDENTAIFCSISQGVTRGAVPVAVIPLDDVDALIEKAYRAYLSGSGDTMRESVEDALTAIGVLPKKRKAKVDTGTDRGLWRTIRLARKGRK